MGGPLQRCPRPSHSAVCRNTVCRPRARALDGASAGMSSMAVAVVACVNLRRRAGWGVGRQQGGGGDEMKESGHHLWPLPVCRESAGVPAFLLVVPRILCWAVCPRKKNAEPSCHRVVSFYRCRIRPHGKLGMGCNFRRHIVFNCLKLFACLRGAAPRPHLKAQRPLSYLKRSRASRLTLRDSTTPPTWPSQLRTTSAYTAGSSRSSCTSRRAGGTARP